MRRRSFFGTLGGSFLVLLAGAPALACGGLLGPNGGVSLVRTTTLAAYHGGVEHYVTAFTFTGGTGNFGSIVPLPGVPTSMERGGNWTLQRLVRETQPVPLAADRFAATAAGVAPAEVLQQARIDALDLTVLKGEGSAVGGWARDNGFTLPPDAPALLDFYAKRSPIFLAAKFDAAAASARGQSNGGVTPIHLTIPTPNPWVPLAILTLGKQPAEFVQADVYLLTDHQPAMLPEPSPAGSLSPTGKGLTLDRSEEASPGLMSDLRSDQGMGWMPDGGMWLSYLRLDTPAVNLRYDLAVDASGRVAPSAVAAGLRAGGPAGVLRPGSRGTWLWSASALGLLVLAGSWALTHRRTGLQV